MAELTDSNHSVEMLMMRDSSSEDESRISEVASFYQVKSDVPRYKVDLDLPPEQRWNEIIDVYKDRVIEIERQLDKDIREGVGERLGPILEGILSSLMAGVTHIGSVYYGRELKAVARRSGISLGKLVALQLTYEAFACCTSVVLSTKEDQTPVHIRTMDWALSFLSDITIEVEFIRGGRTLFIATTWAGYVGVLTGMAPSSLALAQQAFIREGREYKFSGTTDGYSISVNFRNTGGSFWTNVKKAIGRSWPIGFLVREVLESTCSFEQAVQWLSLSELIAPCYLTIAGSNHGEGAIITRDRRNEAQLKAGGGSETEIVCSSRLNLLDEKGLLVQVNMDHWSEDDNDDIMDSKKRRAMAYRDFGALSEVTERRLWQIMKKTPIFNDITVYGTYMCPRRGILRTRIASLGFRDRKGQRLSESQERQLFGELYYVPPSTPQPSPTFVHVPTQNVETPGSVKCKKCSNYYDPQSNAKGQCFHTGSYHAAYDDCSYIKCGFFLGTKGNIGKRHWGCCYQLDYHSFPCPSSNKHEPALE